jgi:hypothetical protein
MRNSSTCKPAATGRGGLLRASGRWVTRLAVKRTARVTPTSLPYALCRSASVYWYDRGEVLPTSPLQPFRCTVEREKRHLQGVRSTPTQRTALPACGAPRRPTPLPASGGLHWGVAPDRFATVVATAAVPARFAPYGSWGKLAVRVVLKPALLTDLPGRADARMVTGSLPAYSQCANALPASSSPPRGAPH